MPFQRSGSPLSSPLLRTLLYLATLFSMVSGYTAVARAQGAVSSPDGPASSSKTQDKTSTATAPAVNATKLPEYAEGKPMTPAPPPGIATGGTESLRAWNGLRVSSVRFSGVPQQRLDPLPEQLALQVGQPLSSDKIHQSLRRLYATGLYSAVEVEGIRTGNDVSIEFDGKPQLFIGRVNVDGVASENLSSLLQGATKLSPGTPYSDAKLDRGTKLLYNVLQLDGYYEAQVRQGHSIDPVNQQMNVNYIVTLGEQARIGKLAVDGQTGITLEKFRKTAKLKPNSKVTRDTVNTALEKMRAYYQKQQLLEAKVKLETKTFQQPINHLDYQFSVDQGHKVIVQVEGVKISKGGIKNLVPVYQEGTVDEDLLNEGDRRVRDFYQRKGYADIKVTHTSQTQPDGQTLIIYHVDLGKIHDVDSVTIKGNRYFSADLIEPRLNVHPASFFDHRGTISQALIASDAATITALYQSNGFSNVAVKPLVQDSDTNAKGQDSKIAHVRVTYQVTEGTQQKFGEYNIVGNIQVPSSLIRSMLNTQVGQPYSSLNLTGDRDTVLTYYLSHGYDHASVNIKQAPDAHDPNLIDATLEITEGEQIHINQVLVSGLHYTRRSTVDPHILVHPGDVLDQTALLDTQRQLYDLTLFNGVNTAVQNPNGDQLKKDVLLQFTEAKRWDVTYGVGLQAQTGNPGSCNAAQRIQQGLNAYGYCGTGFGVSGLVSLNVSRINLRGTDNSLTLKTTYGSLEKVAVLTYTDPHPLGKRNLTFSVSGGYTNEQDVTTYAASRLEGTARVSQRVGKPTTLIYQFAFRRIKVDPNTVQVSADQIPLLSQPVRVGGPGITYIRDTRRPSALDASGGTYNTVQEFFSDDKFGSQSNFNRIDGTNATYYPFGNVHKYVFARETRIAFERSFGNPAAELIPLPERLYAGGAESHRGFGINAAGPRDPTTGFPIGGAAAFINSFELRLPPPTLPYVGSSVSFVIFHDMGNVFVKGSDIWPSFLRLHQPDVAGCRDLSAADQLAPSTEKNSIGLTGRCSDNYFSHALGVGARYATPIGPIRIDASYNLNPPFYPQINDYDLSNPNAPARVSQAGHFNFFFSIGQAF
jgi:outer membrane protein insertion porin family